MNSLVLYLVLQINESMKKALLFTLLAASFVNAQILIDDNQNSNETPDAKAILEVRSTSKGLLLPRLNSAAIQNMQNPQAGMIVFDKDQKVFKGHNGEKWITLPSAGNNQAQTPPTVNTVNFTGNLFVGEQLQGNYQYQGDQTEENSTFVWNSATNGTGDEKTQIGTAKTYTLATNDLDKYIQFCVTPVDNTSTAGEEQCSAWKGVVENKVTPPQTGNVLLEDNFDDATGNGDWNGNTNFPIVERAFQEEGIIKIGSSKYIGYIKSQTIDFNGQNITVTFDVAGWNASERTVEVIINKITKTIEYTNTKDDGLETVSVTFNNVQGSGDVTISTPGKKKRSYIDNVRITRD